MAKATKKNTSAEPPREPAHEPKFLSIEAGLNIKSDLSPVKSTHLDPHKRPLADKYAGGRPPRNKGEDAKLCDELLAMLCAAPAAELRGARGYVTAEACEQYLELKRPKAAQSIVRRAAKRFLANFRK